MRDSVFREPATAARRGPIAPRPVASPDGHVSIEQLQHRVGNRAVVDLLAAGQARLEVGATDDPCEQEADFIARQVVQTITGMGPPVAPTDQPAGGARRVMRRADVVAGGGSIDSDAEHAIVAARRGGRPLDRATRAAMESAFGADFSRVRVHTGGEATGLNRLVEARAFTIGPDIFFRHAADADGATTTSQELLAHELTHTVQQGAARAHDQVHRSLQSDAAGLARSWGGSCCSDITADGPVIRRHSSWEHSLLGDAKPTDLAQIGTWKDLIEQTSNKGGAKRKGKVTLPGIGDIDKAQVMHVLIQELSRIALWQTDPPSRASTDNIMSKTEQDPTFGVIVVRLPADRSDKQLLVTYGELNTLADFYGSLETMQAADPGQRRQIVQSVRKETYLRLREIYDKINDSLTRTERTSDDVRGAQAEFEKNGLGLDEEGGELVTFAGAATPDFISGKVGQADLLAGDKPLIGQGTGAKGDTNRYGATLARNACHFVPESWHAWADYHEKGLTAARQSWIRYAEAKQLEHDMAGQDLSRRPLDRSDIELKMAVKKSQAAKLANDALLNNGFGDHYLQDSYASGHMINKTQIMQWYIEFIDTNKEWDYFKDKNWRKVQQMAYGQDGLADPDQYTKSKIKGYDPQNLAPNAPRNPQSVENLSGDDWMVRFRALGLQVPPSLRTADSPERQVVEGWQLAAGASSRKRKRTGLELVKASPTLNPDAVRRAVGALLADGIVRTTEDVTKRLDYMKGGESVPVSEFAKTSFLLREDYVPSGKAKLAAFRLAQSASKRGDDSGYQKMASAVTYGDYIEFMSSGFIQKATNALHDTFCSGGLTVLTGLNQPAFKVYGDDAMFSSESGNGVRESGITANMSRDSILSVINSGDEGAATTKAILDRLPSYVRYDYTDGEGAEWEITEPIARWHNSGEPGALKDTCMSKIFPDMSWSMMQKMVPGVAGSSLGKITRDAVHGSDAF
jgi:hypothetical protein